MKYTSAAFATLAMALACACSAALADTAAPTANRSAPGAALIVSLGESGGQFAPGSYESFRVFNASQHAVITGLHASASQNAGFKIVSSTCASSLAPHRDCSVKVVWIPQGADMSANGTLTISAMNAQSAPISVSASLSGEVATAR